jgi:hypothetical protein
MTVFGATDEASAHRILKHEIPLGGVALVAPQQTIMKPRCQKEESFWPGRFTGSRPIESRTPSSSRFSPLIHVLKVVTHPIPKQTNKGM